VGKQEKSSPSDFPAISRAHAVDFDMFGVRISIAANCTNKMESSP
jgi:hypothetical protein